MLAELRDELCALPPPIVVFNKSHSGSRLLARVLAAGGVFMGAHLNASHDSLDLLPLVEYLVVAATTPTTDRCGARMRRPIDICRSSSGRHLPAT